MRKVSIVIPTLKNEKILEKCLTALSSSLSFLEKKFTVVVVDNGNSLKVEKLRESGGKIKLIKNKRNLGFAKAVNQGIKASQAKYYLILNDDCFLKKDAAKKMVEYLDKNKKVYATQAVILTPDGKVENIGFFVDLKIAKAYPIRKESFWGKSLSRRYVKGLSATCLLVRGKLFGKIGFFDESFHSYLEDVDLSIRASQKNLNLYPTFTAFATHLHMTTSKKMATYKVRRDFANWIKIIRKNYPSALLIEYWPFLLIERTRNLSGVIKAYLSLLKKSF